MRIQAFHSRDLAKVVDLWNRSLPADPISADRLVARVLLDPDFREVHCLLAREGEQIAGTVLGICSQGTCFGAGRAPPADLGQRAWILALAVDPDRRGCGTGTALLRELEQRFKELV